jgi:SWI/SNF-related matrix-associated actin-dependent regulator 1 of chromatin subfamily A
MSNTYELSKNNIIFGFKYNPDIINDIKQSFDKDNRSYLPKTKQWVVPVTIQNNHSIVNLIEKYGFVEKDSEPIQFEELELENHHQKIKELNLQRHPRDYQNYAIDYMLTAKRCINGDDVGVGKTLETIFACEIANCFPLVVVALSSVKYHWLNEWKATNPNKNVAVLESSSKKNNFDADVMIVSFGMLGKKIKAKSEDEKDTFNPKFPQLYSEKLKCVVIDESHKIKNYKAAMTVMAQRLAKGKEYVFELTGTPILNRPIELVAQLIALQKFNEVFGTWKSFIYRYCDAHKDHFGFLNVKGASNTLELNQVLKSNCYFRREKREVLKDLPELQTTILQVKISNRREYNKAEADIVEYLRENVSAMKANSALMAEYLVMRTTLRQLTGKGKIKEIISWLENFLEETNEKIVVFGTYKDTLQTLSQHFGSKLIDGSLNASKKAENIKDFQESKDRILFGNTKALGTGTDGLQKVCSKMLQIEPSETPGEEDQLIGRLERSGAVGDKINFYKMLAKDTIDVPMFESLEIKREVTEAVNKGKKVKANTFDNAVIGYLTNK